MQGRSCEFCKKAPAMVDNTLCSGCSYLYRMLVELLERHPDLAKGDFDRLKEMYEWRAENTRPKT
jgi:hypothetical protein